MLIDRIEVTLAGGKGGNGIVSFGKMSHSGPDGGNGGKGGDLYLIAEPDITLLNQFSREDHFSAEDGVPGGKNKSTGKNGSDLVLKIPTGTSVIHKITGKVLYEFSKNGQKQLISRGGYGGRGNWEFRSSKRTTPKISEQGTPGEVKELILNLRLIADYGLIGLPNAGKSSLLNELTKAKAKTADYPFTTLSPNLGVFDGKIIADIPGLIEGAAQGKGLGISFLKHIEKVKVVVHCISSESEDIAKDYKTVRNEMIKYNENFKEKTEVVLLTKSDVVSPKLMKKHLTKLKKISPHTQPVSIHDWESLEEVKNILLKLV